MVAGNGDDATFVEQRSEGVVERGQLLPAAPVRHVAGDDHPVDADGAERGAEPPGGVRCCPADAQVEIREVREGLQHAASSQAWMANLRRSCATSANSYSIERTSWPALAARSHTVSSCFARPSRRSAIARC